MGKCRICLSNRKIMNSLCDSIDEDFTYGEMVTSIANVKVFKNEELPNTACLVCCNKLRHIYNFKCQIERSDIELQKSVQMKIIRFSDIKDIRSRIEIRETCSNEAMHHSNITEHFFKSCEDSLNYNNTVIKKLNCEMPVDYEPESDNNQIPESDGEDEAYNMNDYSSDSDKEYTPTKKKSIKPRKKKCNKQGSNKKILAKPVYLSDIRVLQTKDISSIAKRKRNKSNKACKKGLCPHCGKMVQILKIHMLTHSGEKNYKCEKCAKCFYTNSSLKCHEKTHGSKVYKCDKCVAIFSTTSSLKAHILRLHSGVEKKFECETCGKTFQKRGHLLRHCQGVHNMGEKKFTCDECPMSFLTKSNLNHHIRVHTGERPFKCEICSQPYSYRTDFTRHCFKKHGVFLKGRKVNVLSEETLEQERAVMRDLVLRVNGLLKDDKHINPFEGPHAVKSFKMALKALEANQINLKS